MIRTGLKRPNLHLSVSKDHERLLALLDMLEKDERFNGGSVIVYCSLRAQCEEVSSYLSTHGVQADYYHAVRYVCVCVCFVCMHVCTYEV